MNFNIEDEGQISHSNINQFKKTKKLIQFDNFTTSNSQICLRSVFNSNFIYIMITFIIMNLALTIFGIFLLYQQRNKYPIREGSYLLSIMMCACVHVLTIYYPLAWIVVDNLYSQSYIIYLCVLKYFYIFSLYGLYFSYLFRSIRIYAAFSENFTQYFDQVHQRTQNIERNSLIQSNIPLSRIMKILTNMLQEEKCLTLAIIIFSCLACIPLLFNNNFYLTPIQNFNNHDIQQIYKLKGDQLIIVTSLFTVFIFILSKFILKKVPKHYQIQQEASWNLGIQWAKAIFIFIINIYYYEDDWCNIASMINIILNYFEFISIILVSIVPALLRSRFVPAISPFPNLYDFYEFIEDEGDYQNLYCNKSFIYFLSKKDEKLNQSQNLKLRFNLNIYEFYYQVKFSLLKQNNFQLKLSTQIKIADFYIFNPKQSKFILQFPEDFHNSIDEFKSKYNIYNEFCRNQRQKNANLRDQNEELFEVQNEFVDDMVRLYEHCIKYLKNFAFKEYVKTNAFFALKDHYKQQSLNQTNLKLLNLLHTNY